LGSVKRALSELGLKPHDVVMVSGIGQAAKMPQYMDVNFFNGLHGRALPPATMIKSVNPGMTVVAESGDGDMYGEGGNHFVHTIRRNVDITNVVHDNMVYGLTKGQASPTSMMGFRTPVQVDGAILEPFNPLAVAIALDASFVARVYAADIDRTVKVLKEAITHHGYALVDVLQPCVTFNKVNTHRWFRENSYYLEDSHDTLDRVEAFSRATEKDKLPLGVFYKNKGKRTFEENLGVYATNETPVHQRPLDKREHLDGLLRSMR
ncbi:MAG: thiamine pyrophosphate-dependent enzyme, partial [Candidatus Thermoplasmatota archaeon]|nr:thiamine pyrophosphate-dependent enzyme [Candidatus Thermoplasmatota archaeon]